MKRHENWAALDTADLDAVSGGVRLGALNSFLGSNAGVATYQVLGAPVLGTHCFQIRSWGDPHQTISIDGVSTSQIDTAAGIHDLAVLNNTVGGATHISTQTTHQQDMHQSFNREIDITGGSWAVHAIGSGNGGLGAVIQDARGTYELQAGMSVREADGTLISNQGGKLVVTQALSDGGRVDSEISLNDANYLDLETNGRGNAGIGGWTLEKFAQERPMDTQQHLTQQVYQVQQVQPMAPVGANPFGAAAAAPPPAATTNYRAR